MIQKLLDEGELAHHEPRRQAGAMVVSIVQKTCCPVSVDSKVHEVKESELDDDLEFTNETEDELDEDELDEDLGQNEEVDNDVDPSHPAVTGE